MNNIDPDILRELRKATGFDIPIQPVQHNAPDTSASEEAAKKGLLIWDYIMARKGRIEDVLD